MGYVQNQVDVQAAVEIMAAAYDHGVNFYDNAEVYAGGKSEEVMGAALKKLNWRRGSYLVSTKFYWGIDEGINERTPSTVNVSLKVSTARSSALIWIMWT